MSGRSAGSILVVAKPGRPHPGQITAFHGPRFAFPFATDIDQHQKVKVIIGVAGKAHRRQTGSGGVDVEFLAKLADQCRLRRFAGLDLATGKFPQAGHFLLLAGAPAARGHRHRPAPRRRPAPSAEWRCQLRVVGIDRDIAVGQVTGPDLGAAASVTHIDRDGDVGTFHMRRYRRLVIILDTGPAGGDKHAANADLPIRFWSMAAPALPTAMTMRPQFASSPAIAVFTSGEFAIARPIWARRIISGPADINGDEFLLRLAVTDNLLRQILHDPVEGCAKAGKFRGIRVGGSMLPASPVATRKTLSFVEVSLSTVMALKPWSPCRVHQQRCQHLL